MEMEKLTTLTEDDIKQSVAEINGSEEQDRRANFLRRGRIYTDGGKQFLIEELKKEFGNESLNEMRLAPLNLLKKIVNKRSSLYKQSPKRSVQSGQESDQALIDYYVEELDLNEIMDKAHRYFTLYANTALYVLPVNDKLTFRVVPPYQYSVIPNKIDPTQADVWVFNRFVEEGQVTPQDDVLAASGIAGFGRERGYKTDRDLVDSQEKKSDRSRQYIFWTDAEHFTVNDKAEYINLLDNVSFAEQIINPIGVAPIVNLAKDRDGIFWATQFGDTVDLSIAIMKAWTDLLTIAKHQGFSILTVVSEEEPTQLKIGINRAVWLKQKIDGPTPSINYVQAASPLAEYKDLIMELLGLMLSTADLNPKEIGGVGSARSFSSGFQALIETADTLEARKRDQNPLRRAEQELWQIIAKWHNFMFENNDLNEDARSYGKFSDVFSMNIEYADVKPLESINDRIASAKELLTLGLATKEDALKRIYPEMNSEQIEEKLAKIQEELGELANRAMEAIDVEGSQV